MAKYIMRLDDACEKRDIIKWERIEGLLDRYSVKPLVGVIPHCEDIAMEKYKTDDKFWERVTCWENKGWTIAMHGYNHVYTTKNGGLNPINRRSEFAGESLLTQKEKITRGIAIMRQHGIDTQVFFAPSHTFDENTLIALKECSDIRFISDTVANKPYLKDNITFVPQQSGSVRKLPFSMVTFCYHPNEMRENDFLRLEDFLKKYKTEFIEFPLRTENRRFSLYDRMLMRMYLRLHR